MTYLATSLKLAKFSVTERTAVDALVDLSYDLWPLRRRRCQVSTRVDTVSSDPFAVHGVASVIVISTQSPRIVIFVKVNRRCGVLVMKFNVISCYLITNQSVTFLFGLD